MRAERWKQIKELFQAALAQPPEKRAAFLPHACPDDAQRKGKSFCEVHGRFAQIPLVHPAQAL